MLNLSGRAAQSRAEYSVGNGSELEGIVTVYRTGWLVGAGQLLTVVIAAHGVFRLGKWGYEKLIDYLQERGYIVAAGEVV